MGKTMFRGASFRLLHNPPPAALTAVFARLRRQGCDAIAIIPQHYVSLQPGTPNLAPPPATARIPWFIYPDVGQDKEHPYHNTPEPELVLDACQAAAGQGLRVLLKPHIESYSASWRGYISVKNHTAEWVAAYRHRFLGRYLDIARQVDGAILCLGSELYTVTKELGAEFWIELAQWVRGQGFQGELTYAANWGWADDAEYRRLTALWPHLDYIGVDAHFPLLPPGYTGATDVNTLLAAWHRQGVEADWCPRIDDDLLALSRHSGRPLLFTAIGYANHQLAAEAPRREALPTDVRDDELQGRLAEAFRRRWDPVAEFAGYFWHEATLDQANKPPISHDILGRPVEAILFQPPAPEPAPSVAGLVLDQALAARLRQVYAAYDATAVHCYDPFVRDQAPAPARTPGLEMEAFGIGALLADAFPPSALPPGNGYRTPPGINRPQATNSLLGLGTTQRGRPAATAVLERVASTALAEIVRLAAAAEAPAPAAPPAGRSALAEWVGTKGFNYTSGRQGRQPIAISNHLMMGTLNGTIKHFQTEHPCGKGASANYGIDRAGRIVQFVNDNDTAWANGPIYDPNVSVVPWIAQARDNRWDPNTLTISIQWEGAHGDGEWIDWQDQRRATLRRGSVTQWWAPSEQQYQAGLALIRELCTRHNIALEEGLVELRQHICGHSDFDNGKKWFCPGPGFPLQQLLNDLQAGGPTDYPQYTRQVCDCITALHQPE